MHTHTHKQTILKNGDGIHDILIVGLIFVLYIFMYIKYYLELVLGPSNQSINKL